MTTNPGSCHNLSMAAEDFEDDAKITADYQTKRKAFRLLARRMSDISKGSGGILSISNRMYWSSVLFTRLSVMTKSILLLTPAPGKPRAHWDFSAVASLARNFFECFFVFYFLCAGDISDDERDARLLMMHLHDNFSRNRMLKELGDGILSSTYEHHQHDLKSRIEQTSYFANLTEKRKVEVLKGDRTPFVQDTILDEIGFDKDDFRAYYRFFSSHTHTGPISFYRMSENGNGSGFERPIEKAYMAIALDLAIQFAHRACEEILSIFPNAELRGAQVSDRNIGRYLEKLKAVQERGEIITP